MTEDVKGRYGSAGFYTVRQRIYLGLLLFVVVVGLPIVGVPSLRERLSERVLALKRAMSQNIVPLTVNVGENHQPFPAEFEKPAPLVPSPPQLPPLDRIFTRELPAAAAPQASAPLSHRRAGGTDLPPSVTAPDTGSFEEPQAASAQNSLNYQKGQVEQEVYDLLLQSNPTAAGMVRGSNPSLHFKSWGAVSRGDDIYWVRLKFQSDGNPDVEYIWRVKLASKEVTPLSYNARALSQ